MFNYLTMSIIPILLVVIVTYGMIKGRQVYEWFIEGAKEGLNVCLRIFPSILAILIAVGIFKKAGLMEMLTNLLSPVTNLIGLPKEILPLVIVKPLSGSGAIGVFTDIVKSFGPDSKIGLIASVIMGTTETIFYTVTVYYGVIKVKKVRHTIWAAVMADITAIFAAIFIVNAFFF